MKRIIEKGTSTYFVISCWACHCKFEITALDIKEACNSGLEYVTCPECGQLLFVDTLANREGEVVVLNS